MIETPTQAQLLKFDLYTIRRNEYGGIKPYRMMQDVVFDLVLIITGDEKDVFTKQIIDKGWAGTIPGWSYDLPIVIVPHSSLLNEEHIGFLTQKL